MVFVGKARLCESFSIIVFTQFTYILDYLGILECVTFQIFERCVGIHPLIKLICADV